MTGTLEPKICIGAIKAKGEGSSLDSSLELFAPGTWELFMEQLFQLLPAGSPQSLDPSS